MYNGGIIGLKNQLPADSESGIWTGRDHFYARASGTWPLLYLPLSFTVSGGCSVVRNNTDSVDILKTSGTDNNWGAQAYTAVGYTQPVTLEFNKTASVNDDGLSYAMISLNADPTTNASYNTLDYASYPYRQESYVLYNNGAAITEGGSWSQANKFYLVYANNQIKHYNGSKLLYTAPYNAPTVNIDSSLYRVNQTNCRFTNVRLAKATWNGTGYV